MKVFLLDKSDDSGKSINTRNSKPLQRVGTECYRPPKSDLKGIEVNILTQNLLFSRLEDFFDVQNEGFILGKQKDRRVDVVTPKCKDRHKEFPFSAISSLDIFFDSIYQSGTVFMIGPQHILTSAHNVFHQINLEDAKQIFVSPGRHYTEFPFGIHLVTHAYLFTKTSGDYSEDMAILKIDQKIGDYTGWIGLMDLSLNDLENLDENDNLRDIFFGAQILHVVGYGNPEIKQDKTILQSLKAHYGELIKDRSEIRSNLRKDDICCYKIDTSPGQSGSPLLILQGNNFYAVGVHNNYSQVHNFNIGARLTSDKIYKICQVIENSYSKARKTPKIEVSSNTQNNIEKITDPSLKMYANLPKQKQDIYEGTSSGQDFTKRVDRTALKLQAPTKFKQFIQNYFSSIQHSPSQAQIAGQMQTKNSFSRCETPAKQKQIAEDKPKTLNQNYKSQAETPRQKDTENSISKHEPTLKQKGVIQHKYNASIQIQGHKSQVETPSEILTDKLFSKYEAPAKQKQVAEDIPKNLNQSYKSQAETPRQKDTENSFSKHEPTFQHKNYASIQSHIPQAKTPTYIQTDRTFSRNNTPIKQEQISSENKLKPSILRHNSFTGTLLPIKSDKTSSGNFMNNPRQIQTDLSYPRYETHSKPKQIELNTSIQGRKSQAETPRQKETDSSFMRYETPAKRNQTTQVKYRTSIKNYKSQAGTPSQMQTDDSFSRFTSNNKNSK